MDENHQYDLAILNNNNKIKQVIYRICVGDLSAIVNQFTLPSKCTNVTLHIESDPLYYYFYCYYGGEDIFLGKAQEKYLSTEVACGFTGTYSFVKQGFTIAIKNLLLHFLDI